MALGKYPHLWAGGMAIMALADLTQAYNEGSDWTRGYLTTMLGGTPEEIPAQYRASSPLTYAEQISVPLLIIQGRNDMRSTPHQIEFFAEKIPAQNQCVEIDWCDMGHGGITIEGLVTIQEHLLAFAHRTLTRQRL